MYVYIYMCVCLCVFFNFFVFGVIHACMFERFCTIGRKLHFLYIGVVSGSTREGIDCGQIYIAIIT